MRSEIAPERRFERVRRPKIQLAAWGVGTALIAALWALHEWQVNGAFERFAHEGNSGDWNPTLPALIVVVWGLVVGITTLRALLERPATVVEIDREAQRLAAKGARADAGLRSFARKRAERLRRLHFHIAAWCLGVILVTPLNALIEWQDNGGFERISDDSRPGSWDPWVVDVAVIWALVVIVFALWVYLDRPRKGRSAGGDAHRLTPNA